jgi:hypothetical protein
MGVDNHVVTIAIQCPLSLCITWDYDSPESSEFLSVDTSPLCGLLGSRIVLVLDKSLVGCCRLGSKAILHGNSHLRTCLFV